MDDSSTSLERSPGELLRFGIACLGVLLGISGIIFAQPVLGVIGAIALLLALCRPWRSSESD